MTQLLFSSTFDRIVEEFPSVWKKEEDIPKDVLFYIEAVSSRIVIYNQKNHEYRCSCCFYVLEDFYCKNCDKQYEKFEYKEGVTSPFLEVVSSFDRFNYSNVRYFYVFDVVDGEVLLYVLEQVSSRNNLERFITRSSVIEISNIYWVKKNSLIAYDGDKEYFYYKIAQELKKQDSVLDFYYGISLSSPIWEDFDKLRFLYTDNLNVLRDTIYRYTRIWEAKHFLSLSAFDILSLTFEPIFCPAFEYLVNYHLYQLAFSASHLMKGKNFLEIFGVDKNFLPFMQKMNISYYELYGLQICKCVHPYLIECVGSAPYVMEELSSLISPNYQELGDYLEQFHFSYNHLPEYCDYIRIAKKLGYSLENKKVLYPDDFMKEHDRLYFEFELFQDPKIHERISSMSNMLSFSIYEDSQYIIFPASSLESMLEEGSQQHNCLRTYVESYSHNDCQIYFMRDKKELGKSFVTIEVLDGRIVQARGRFNENVTDSINLILKKWEKELIPIVKDF